MKTYSSSKHRAHGLRRPFSFLIAFGLLLAPALGLSAQEQLRPAEIDRVSCTSATLAEALDSFYWATLVRKGKTLLGIDPVAGHVVQIDLSSRGAELAQRRQIDDSEPIQDFSSWTQAVSKRDIDESRPFLAFTDSGNELVQVFGDGTNLRVLWYDQDLNLRNELLYGDKAVRDPSSPRLIAPYRWVTTQGHMAGYGMVSSSNSQGFELGFFSQPLPRGGTASIPPVRLFEPMGNPSFYAVGNPMVVARGSEIYYLVMDGYASLNRYDLATQLEPTKIPGLPGENTPLNDPEFHNIRLEERDLLQDHLEAHEGPWGLYEQDGSIFLLSRSLSGESVAWVLQELIMDDYGGIDTEATAARATRLQTRAQQIVLVPSEKPGEWFVLEQDANRKFTTIQTCTNLTASDSR